MNPDITNIMYLGAVTGLLASGIGVLMGASMLGFSGEILRIIFGITALLNILFRINIAGFGIGIGLVNNIIDIFSTGDLIGIGYISASLIGILTFVSGVMIIVGGSD